MLSLTWSSLPPPRRCFVLVPIPTLPVPGSTIVLGEQPLHELPGRWQLLEQGLCHQGLSGKRRPGLQWNPPGPCRQLRGRLFRKALPHQGRTRDRGCNRSGTGFGQNAVVGSLLLYLISREPGQPMLKGSSSPGHSAEISCEQHLQDHRRLFRCGVVRAGYISCTNEKSADSASIIDKQSTEPPRVNRSAEGFPGNGFLCCTGQK